MKKLFLVINLFIFFILTAQHQPVYNSYAISPILINPAFTGADGALSFGIVSRIQFLGIESGNPLTNTLFAHTPLKNKNIALGTIMSYEKFGPQSNFNGNLMASYKIKISKFRLTFASSLGYLNRRFTFENANPVSFDKANEDPLSITNPSENKFNLGLGINISYKFFYLGAFSPTLKFSKIQQTELQNDFFYNQIHIYGGINYRISNSFVIKPSFLLRNLKSSGIQLDGNLLISAFDKVTFGANFKLNNAIAGIAMIHISPQFSVCYSYEHITTNLKNNSSGNHELHLKYIFKYYVNDLNVKKFK